MSVHLRPRGGWQAMDLGFRMARTWWRPAWGAWLAAYLPAAALLHAAFPDRPWLAAALLWWLTPVFDRFVLHIMSRAVFGEPPGVGETLAAWRDILRPGLLAGLTFLRLDPLRSYMLPVWQLEKQTGRDARARRRVLGSRLRGAAFWLTVTCLHFQLVVLLSLGFAAWLLMPAGADVSFGFAELMDPDDGTWWNWLDSACYVVAVSVVQPFYVAAGFSLYLNRRTILEGWDIELQLRRLAGRLAGASSLVVLAVFVLGAAGFAPGTVAAERSAQAEIVEVMSAPDLQPWREKAVWRFRGDFKKERGSSFDFENIALLIADIAQALGWAVLVAGILALVVFARRLFRNRVAEPPAPPLPVPAAAPAHGPLPSVETLPADPAGAAALMVEQRRIVEALSLLYRAALQALARGAGAMESGYTENEALHAARARLAAPAVDYFD
ncbi:MAG TPA: hypothetical protein VG873_05010, partial [Burkholderiales bacterium]|nr:hypothetical protein [Burkholderiales bacterium]